MTGGLDISVLQVIARSIPPAPGFGTAVWDGIWYGRRALLGFRVCIEQEAGN